MSSKKFGGRGGSQKKIKEGEKESNLKIKNIL
jgi:hypothetical protein